MSQAAHIAEGLQECLGKPDLYWFVSYVTAVEGLTAEQAARVPAPRFNSIWGVTLHLTLCQRFAKAVISGEPADPAVFFSEGVWPAIREPGSEAAWQQAKAGLLAANRALAECAAAVPDERLDDPATGGFKRYQYLQGHLAHNSYHMGEIVSIRHMLGLWLENT
jgi:hypothetical protein